MAPIPSPSARLVYQQAPPPPVLSKEDFAEAHLSLGRHATQDAIDRWVVQHKLKREVSQSALQVAKGIRRNLEHALERRIGMVEPFHTESERTLAGASLLCLHFSQNRVLNDFRALQRARGRASVSVPRGVRIQTNARQLLADLCTFAQRCGRETPRLDAGEILRRAVQEVSRELEQPPYCHVVTVEWVRGWVDEARATAGAGRSAPATPSPRRPATSGGESHRPRSSTPLGGGSAAGRAVADAQGQRFLTNETFFDLWRRVFEFGGSGGLLPQRLRTPTRVRNELWRAQLFGPDVLSGVNNELLQRFCSIPPPPQPSARPEVLHPRAAGGPSPSSVQPEAAPTPRLLQRKFGSLRVQDVADAVRKLRPGGGPYPETADLARVVPAGTPWHALKKCVVLHRRIRGETRQDNVASTRPDEVMNALVAAALHDTELTVPGVIASLPTHLRETARGHAHNTLSPRVHDARELYFAFCEYVEHNLARTPNASAQWLVDHAPSLVSMEVNKEPYPRILNAALVETIRARLDAGHTQPADAAGRGHRAVGTKPGRG